MGVGVRVKAAVENGAMLTTYLFMYTSECTILQSYFQNFLRLRRQGGIDPLTRILRTPLMQGCRCNSGTASLMVQPGG